MVTVGIDIGGSTTKIVGFSEGKLVNPISVKAADPLTSIYGALGRFTYENGFSLEDVSKLMVTGVGASFIKDSLYSRPCYHVSEFESVAKGGIYLSNLERAVVASMGTGTALVYAEKSTYCEYLGGTGVGGGTLAGLSKLILGMDNIDHITDLASDGNLQNIDLQIADIASQQDSFDLPGNMTASNFGKVSDLAGRADIALGVINMIFETVGMMSIFAARQHGIKDIVLTGHLTTVPQAAPTFKILSDMFGVNFIIPELSQFATVIGAALQNTNN